jgi:hypothetical protein
VLHSDVNEGGVKKCICRQCDQSCDKSHRFGTGGNKLLSSSNQVIYPHSGLSLLFLIHIMVGHQKSIYSPPLLT